MSGQLLYKTIYDNLRGKIFSGEFKPGDLLPSEYTLCASFDASRETVRKALKALENEGLIHSRSKVGNFVSAPNHSDFSITFTEEKEGFTTQFLKVHGIYPDERVRSVLEIDEKQLVIEFSQITRDRNDVPVAIDLKYIPYRKAMPVVENEMRFASIFPGTTDVEPFDYYTEIEVSAVAAPARVAELMDCEPGSPLLLIEKTFIRQYGTKIGYSMQYSNKSFGRLHGVSGPMK